MPTVIETTPMPESEALSPEQLAALKDAAGALQGAPPAAALEEFEKMLAATPEEPGAAADELPEELLDEAPAEEGPPMEGTDENALESMDVFQNLFKGKGEEEEAPEAPEEPEE
jgi:hypothetical protein